MMAYVVSKMHCRKVNFFLVMIVGGVKKKNFRWLESNPGSLALRGWRIPNRTILKRLKQLGHERGAWTYKIEQKNRAPILLMMVERTAFLRVKSNGEESKPLQSKDQTAWESVQAQVTNKEPLTRKPRVQISSLPGKSCTFNFTFCICTLNTFNFFKKTLCTVLYWTACKRFSEIVITSATNHWDARMLWLITRLNEHSNSRPHEMGS